jgi:mRNA interferase MazF
VGCEAFDVVVVPFPFTDRAASKRRPALVLSDASAFNTATGQVVLAIDHERQARRLAAVRTDRGSRGPWPTFRVTCAMKVFTFDQQLIRRKAGQLVDRRAVTSAVYRLLKSIL